MTTLVDQHGRPLRREVLTKEIAGPTIAGLRSPIAGYPGDGLNPVRLAQIMRAADHGSPLAYFELAEQIEERDLHYVGVLSTRKRSVCQVDISVDAASDDAHDVAIADMVRDWLKRDELADEMFDILDAVGKGVSFTEIIWDTSEGQWQPARLEWRDPRWFEFDPRDGRTPLLRGGESGGGQPIALEPFKFIRHQVRAKSGLPVRSGLSRVVAWAWMFKAFTLRDWAIFAQTFGQPVRVGKYGSNASAEDRATLFRAVANIAGDCAAIIPQGMEIEFIESANVGAGSDLYERRADWFDRQTSKAVLGQTTTTDAVSGGHAVAQEHRLVQEDIEAADCKSAAGTFNRDLVRPWIDLEHGPQKRYPRVKIERQKGEDLVQLATALKDLVPLGLRVGESEIRDKFNLAEPGLDERILTAPGLVPSIVTTPPALTPPAPAPATSLHAAQTPVPSPAEQITDRMALEAEPDMRAWMGRIALMMQSASSLGELREMVVSAYPALDATALVDRLAVAFVAAQAAGMSDVEAEGA